MTAITNPKITMAEFIIKSSFCDSLKTYSALVPTIKEPIASPIKAILCFLSGFRFIFITKIYSFITVPTALYQPNYAVHKFTTFLNYSGIFI